jgi:hypothetical protein
MTMLTRIAVALLMIATAATVAAASTVGPPTHVPEPSMFTLVAGGLGGALLYVRNRRSRK